MVKLYALCILYKKQDVASWLKAAYDLQSYGFFQRSSIQEFMAFTSKTIVERTQNASRQSVKQGDYVCHVYVRADGLSGIVIANQDYPQRVAHTLITNVLNEFEQQYPSSTWANIKDTSVNFPQANAYLVKYQNPKEADAMTKIQEDLDETKIILLECGGIYEAQKVGRKGRDRLDKKILLHNTIEAVLQRGEKLDDLVSKSEGLSMQSKAFYKTARKTNSCCNLG